MITNETILTKITEIQDNIFVLATVVSVEGSAYRREGSKMVITSNGDTFGLISGGCLEADVIEVAKIVFQEQKPILKRYELDEDLVWGLGLGCPGIVNILIEPITIYSPFYEEWVHLIQKNSPHITCKILRNENETVENLLVTEENKFDCWKEDDVVLIAREKLIERNPKSEMIMIPGLGEVFFDVYSPSPLICIFGAGNDAIPVAQMAHHLGFQTMVVDGRPAFNTKERFPHAKRLLKHVQELERVDFINQNTFVVIMNHHLQRDMDSIMIALKSNSHYVGILGPRKRREKMLTRLRETGEFFSVEQLGKMHSPIGLDIGADTSEEIALSIMAEIVAVRKGHNGSSLKNSYYIHSHPALEEIR